MLRVGIIGATGYAGAELVRIVTDHPAATLTTITSRQYTGQAYSEIYPAMTGVVDQVCETFEPDAIAEKVHVAFTALPHKLSMEVVPPLLERGIKVIDLSADFRFRDVKMYEAYYQSHTAPDVCKKAVYGLSEIYGNQIQDADLIGNPGCYPTSALLPLVPLIRERVIDPRSLIIDSKSGVSGAGRSPSLATLFCEVNEGFKAYKIAEHRHTPEIEAILSQEAGETLQVSFVPHLVPLNRGMLTTIYATLKSGKHEEVIRGMLTSFYEKHPFVRILPSGRFPNVADVRGTNYCSIGIRVDTAMNRLIIVSVIDNLVKGAAGQAVQNMNLMFGLPVTAGLDNSPFPV